MRNEPQIKLGGWRAVKFIGLAAGIVFIAFLLAYTASQNWHFVDPATDYVLDSTTDTISGLPNIELVTPSSIARLTLHPGRTYTAETKSGGDYNFDSGLYGSYLTATVPEKVVRLANSANGGYGNFDPAAGLASGSFLSRIFDSTVAGSNWTNIGWTDKRSETAEASAALTATISALYRFNTAPGIIADSGTYANTLANSGAALSGVQPNDANGEGLYNQSGYFNGASYLSRADAGSTNLNFGQDSFSMECWVKTSMTGKGPIINKRAAVITGTLGWEIGLNYDDTPANAGKPYLAIILQDYDVELSQAANFPQYLSAGRPVNDNQWHHIAAYRQIDQIAIYVDGIFQGKSGLDNPAANVNNAATMYIGWATETYEGTTTNYYYTGKLDELILYKGRVLTESEIFSRYERGLGVKFRVRASDTATSGWTDAVPAWSGEIINSSTTPSSVTTVSGRYFQYQAVLESRNRGATPMLTQVAVSGPASPADKTDDGSQSVEFDPEQIYTNPWGTSRRTMTVYRTDYISVKPRTDLTAARAGTEDGITALWRLEGNTTDLAGGDNPAILMNSPVYSTTVVALSPSNTNSIQLDGVNQYLTAAHSANIAFKYDHTLEAWIYPTVALDASGLPSQLAPAMTILDKGGYKVWWDNKSGKMLYELQDVTAKGVWQKDNLFKNATANFQSATPYFSELIQCMAVYRGKLYVGVSGNFVATTTTNGEARIYVYDGKTWELAYDPVPLGALLDYERVLCMTVAYDRLYCGLGITIDDGDLAIFDGTNWTMNYGLDAADYEGVYSLGTWKDGGTEYLYAGVGYSGNDADVYYINSAGTWTQVANNLGNDDAVTSLYVFKNKLYIGTGLDRDEAIVYRYDTPPTVATAPVTVYNPSATEALENVQCMTEYNGKIYVGFDGNAAGDADYAVSDSGDSGTWTLYKYNQIGGVGTFEGIYTMFTYDGKLYAGLGTSAGDCQLWYTTDGTGWTRDDDLYGIAGGYRTIKSQAEYMGRLYLGFGSALYNATTSIAITAGEPYDLFYLQSKGYIASTMNSFNVNTWYHIQAAYDRSVNRKMYLRISDTGGLIEENTVRANMILNASSVPLYIGADRQYGRYFRGLIDEVGLFNTAYIGAHQGPAYYESGEIAAPNNGYVRWNNIAWGEQERYGDELTAESGVEMAGLWHLNNNTIDEFGSTTDPANTLLDFTAGAKFGGYAGWFNGTNNKIAVWDGAAYNWTSAGLTVEAWVKNSTMLPQSIVAKGAGTTLEFRLYIENDYRPAFWVSSGGSGKSPLAYGPVARTVTDNRWHHIVGVYDGTSVKVFVDGESGGSVSYSGTVYNGADAVWIGSDQEGEWYYTGVIDEVAIYRRPLQSAEVLSRYQKGVTSLKLRVSVRDGGGYGSWVGPNDTDSDFKIGQSEVISGTTGLVGRAIKYRAEFTTANPLYPARFDLLKLAHQPYYSNQSPWVSNSSGWGYTGLAGFFETRGSGSATVDNVRYQISHPANPAEWWWYNAGWQIATSSVMSSTWQTINDNIYTFDPDGAPQSGNFYFKAFLVSNGIEYVALDEVKVADQSVTVTYPNGGEQWALGEQRQFQWSKKGAVTAVKIELARNGLGGSWEVITDTVDAAAGVYTWTVTSPVSTTCYARITSLQDASVWDTSNAQFEIKEVSGKSITIGSPSAGDNWIAEDPHSITWTTLGGVGNVTIQYSKSGNFDDTKTLVTGIPNTTTIYNWTPVSSDISSAAGGKIRIMEDDGSPTTDSNAFFVKAGFNITVPNTYPISWVVGTNQTIQWFTKGDSGDVKLEYSRDDFNSDINIITPAISNSPGAGSYVWTPIPITTTLGAAYNVKVRIKTLDATKPPAEDKSDNGFKICGSITVGQPNGGETLYVNDMGNVITWTKVGNIVNYQIRYSTNGGTSWPYNIVASTGGTDLGGGVRGFTWEPIPDTISPDCRVKITDADDGPFYEVLDTSNANFTIKGKLALTTHPGQASGQEFVIDSTTPISWNTVGTIPNVNVWYIDDFGSVKITGPISNTGGILWTITDDLNPDPNSNVRVWVENADDTTVKSQSLNAFKIKGEITVGKPVGGDTYLAYHSSYQTTTYSITWTVTGSIPFVRLEYSTTGEFGAYSTVAPPAPVIIACGATGTYNYTWQVPSVLSVACRVKVSDSADTAVYGLSQPTDFTVKGKLEVTAPISSDIWAVGDTDKIIKFKVTGNIGDARIEYLDNTSTWQPITTSFPATAGIENSYQWSSGVADVITTTARIRVRPVIAERADPSESPLFTIKTNINVYKPALNDSVYVYHPTYQPTKYPITYTYTGTVTNVKFQYSANGDAGPWTDIGTGFTNGDGTGQYNWEVPNVITSTAKVKVLDNDANHPAAEGKSQQFLIKGRLIVAYPSAGDAVTYQDNIAISWTAVGSFTPVKIEYYDGTSWVTPEITSSAASVSGTNNSYPWNIPDKDSDTCKIRVSSTDWQNISAEGGVFRIKGKVQVTTPAGGEVYVIGQNPVISGTKSTSVSAIKLEYYNDGSVSPGWETVVTSYAVAPLTTWSYSGWTVPDKISADPFSPAAKIRITDVTVAGYSDVTSTSNSFKVIGSFTITYPDAVATWGVGEPRPITWTTNGSISKVNIQWSINGVTWTNFVTNYDNNGNGTTAIGITVPDAITNTFRVRVAANTDSTVYKDSPNFVVKGRFLMTQPISTTKWLVNNQEDIKWDVWGTISKVNIYYWNQTIPDWVSITTNAPATNTVTTGQYLWTIPNLIRDDIKVKVENVDDTSVVRESDPFKIRGKVHIDVPNGGQVYYVYDTVDQPTKSPIQFTITGSITTALNLEYSIDDAVWNPIATTTVASAGVYTYQWEVPGTVPTNICKTVKVRIVDTAVEGEIDPSDANFEIRGKIFVTGPITTTVWAVGEIGNSIVWTSVGNIGSVTLQYLKDITWTNITTVASNDGTNNYLWSAGVANAISSAAKIRVVPDPAFDRASPAESPAFSIKSTITVGSPMANAVLLVDSTTPITWTYTGTVSKVNIEFNINEEVTWTAVATADTAGNGTGSYDWKVPNAISTNVNIRISDADAGHPAGTVEGPTFNIKGKLTVGAPISTSEWTTGESRAITWTANGGPFNIKLELSTDDGLSWEATPIVASYGSVSGTNTYTWNPVWDRVSSKCRIRISPTQTWQSISDVSPQFKIKGLLTVTAPSMAGQSGYLTIGQNPSITGTKSTAVTSIKIEYYNDSAIPGWETLIASHGVGVGTTWSYGLWTVPDKISADPLSPAAKIRVTDVTDAGITCSSESGTFKVCGSFTVTYPPALTVWLVGESRPITWTTNGSINNVNVQWSKDGGSNWTTFSNGTNVSNNGNGTTALTITVPDAIANTFKVRVVASGDSTVWASSPNIEVKGRLQITAPIATTIWRVGNQEYITWDVWGTISKVNIYYWNQTIPDWVSITTNAPATNTPTTGQYLWTIPNLIRDDFKVKVENVDDSSVVRESDPFKIRGKVQVNNPNGAEVYYVYDSVDQTTKYPITYTVTGAISQVKIEYLQSGITWTLISTTNATGLWMWEVPGAAADICKAVRVRVTDNINSDTADDSNADFEIRGKIFVTGPITTTVWAVGEIGNSIVWTSVGNIGSVTLQYLKAGSWYDITTVASNDGINSYLWVAPGVADAISTAAKVRVKPDETFDRANIAESPAFTIKTTITIGKPTAGESLFVDNTYTITWTYTGTVSQVKIEYNKNDEVTWTQVALVTASQKFYDWQVPDAISDNVNIRISDNDAGHPPATVESGQFYIKGQVTVGAPAFGAEWTYNESRNITWTANGGPFDVRIELSTNNGGSWEATPIVASYGSVSGTNTYPWNPVWDRVSAQCKVRVKSTGDLQNISDESEVFKIKGQLQIGYPAGGEVFVVNSSPTITGTKSTAVRYIKIECDYDDTAPGDWVTLAASYDVGAGTTWSYGGWTVLDRISANPLGPAARIRVTDVTDASITNVIATSNNFKVIGGFTVTYPTAGTTWLVGESRPITWTTNGAINAVNVQWSKDGGSNWTTFSNGANVPNNGNGTTALTITVPDAITNTFKVRVVAFSDDTVWAASPNIEVKGRLQITQPISTTKWLVDNQEEIKWDVYGSVSSVNIDYRTGLLQPWVSITTTAPATYTSGAGRYGWTIPNVIGDTLQVRVVQSNDSAVESISAQYLKIRGKVQINNPNNGTEVYYPYDAVYQTTKYPITYTVTGSVSQVRLEYCPDGVAGPWTQITLVDTPVSGTSTYLWEVPGALTDIKKTVRVQIVDTTADGESDYSDANFEIRGRVTVTSPDASATWAVGETGRTINWDGVGNIGNVTLEYLKGVSWYSIATVASSNGPNSYLWNAGTPPYVADAISTAAKIRIVPDPAFGRAITDDSDPFTIKSTLMLGKPTAGESLYVDNSYTITWTYTGTVTNVKLEYNINDEVTWTNIATVSAGAVGQGSYDWTVPNAISSNVNLRISDADAGHPAATVEGVQFFIKGQITIGSPALDAEWTKGESRAITWTANGGPFPVKIELSTNNGGSWEATPILGAYTSVSGTNSWTWNPVWDRVSSQCKIKISSTDGWQNISGLSNSFKIKGTVTVGYPAGGETFVVNNNPTITGTKSGAVTAFKIEVDYDDTAPGDWVTLAASYAVVSGSATWSYGGWTVLDRISANPLSPAARIRVTDVTDASITNIIAISNNFKVKGAISVSSPAFPDEWLVGSSQTITWSATGSVSPVNIYYSTDDFATITKTIATNVLAGSGTRIYTWPAVADNITSGYTVKVKVCASNDQDDVKGVSSIFKIKGAIEVREPSNPGIELEVGSAYTITWRTTGQPKNVRIVYYTDIIPETEIVASTPATYVPIAGVTYEGRYPNWVVPPAVSKQARIKIYDKDDNTVYDISDNVFRIKAKITVTSPNTGNEVGIVGADPGLSISWAITGTATNVKLEYTVNNGLTWTNIATVDAGATPYNWVIPDVTGIISNNCRVRVTDADAGETDILDISDNLFRIRGKLNLDTPNVAADFEVGDTVVFQWTATGPIAQVNILYSTDDFATVTKTLFSGLASGSGTKTQNWTIPNDFADLTTSRIIRFKVVDSSDSAVYDNSDAMFKIKGKFQVIDPNSSNLTWLVGELRTITWTTTGKIASVNVQYSKDGTTNWTTFSNGSGVPDNAAGSGLGTTALIVTVPDAISPTFRVRVVNQVDTAVADPCDYDIRIRGRLQIYDPIATTKWLVSNQEFIRWNVYGSIPTVNIEYQDALVPGWIPITTSAPATNTPTTGQYLWAIPNFIKDSVQVRVVQSDDAAVFSESAQFKIRGKVRIDTPNGGETYYPYDAVYQTTKYPITYTVTGSVSQVRLEYCPDGVAGPWTVIALINPPSAGTYTYMWEVPGALNDIKETVRVQIVDTMANGESDYSDNPFKIKGIMQVSEPPDADGVWEVGQSGTILWSVVGAVGDVTLQYLQPADGFWYDIASVSTTSGANSYVWGSVADAITSTARVRVKPVISTKADIAVSNPFKIKGRVLVTAPTLGYVAKVGESCPISWVISGTMNTVTLQYKVGIDAWQDITTVPAGLLGGTYNGWTTPDRISTNVRVRVFDTSVPEAFDDSDQFEIRGKLHLDYPSDSGLPDWVIFGTYPITWTAYGTINQVELRYDLNNGNGPDGNPDTGDEYLNVITTTASGALTHDYYWTVPDIASANTRIRVVDVTNSAVKDESDYPFRIAGTITVEYPGTGNVFTVGDPIVITGTKSSGVTQADIQYWNGNLSQYVSVAISASIGTGLTWSYNWIAPDCLMGDLRIKAIFSEDTTIFDIGDQFRVKGNLTLGRPNGNEVFTVGTTEPITWTMMGSIINVNLYYSLDNFVSSSRTIATDLSAVAGSYNWPVPDDITAGYSVKIRITDSAYEIGTYDDSNNPFKIRGKTEVQPITWTVTGSIQKVRLTYTYGEPDGRTTEIEITPDTAGTTTGNTGVYLWTVPNLITSKARIKVYDKNDNNTWDESDNTFKTRGNITVGSPNGNEAWLVGVEYPITWTTVGPIANVGIQVSIDPAHSTWETLVTSTAAAAGVYTWTVLDRISATAQIRVLDAADATVRDDSNNDFRIRGRFNVVYPNGGQIFVVGQTNVPITWTSTGTMDTVKIEYSRDDFNSDINTIIASTENDGSYPWPVIPDAIVSTMAVKIRVSSTTDYGARDDSDSGFKIRGDLNVLVPNNPGIVWTVGEQRVIQWSKTGSISQVELRYSDDNFGTYNSISITNAAALSYTWTVPDAIGVTPKMKIRILDVADSTVYDDSDNAFKIKGNITIGSPKINDIFTVYHASYYPTTHPITWTLTGTINNVKIDYSKDNFATSWPVVASTSGPAGLYNWPVPDDISSTVRIRIYDAADSTVYVDSDTFYIKGKLFVTAPLAGNAWKVGSSQNIQWNTTGTIASVKLDYLSPAVNDWINITPSTTNTGIFGWLIPNDITYSNNVIVRVINLSDPNVYTDSGGFKIRGDFIVAQPNSGAEIWEVATNQVISWTTTGTINNIDLLYSTDNFGPNTWTIFTNTLNSSPYNWAVPDNVSNSVRVRVRDTNDPNLVYDDSNNDFSIVARMQVTKPSAGEKWQVGEKYSVKWKCWGTVPNVKIDYSVAPPFTVWKPVIASYVNNASNDGLVEGSYEWTIPDDISETVIVRVADTRYPSLVYADSGQFKIKGAVRITAPVLDDVFYVYHPTANPNPHNIVFSVTGTGVGAVKIQYSKDNFATTPTLIATMATVQGVNTYQWQVDDAIGINVKIRVEKETDSETMVDSEFFMIKGKYTVTAPGPGAYIVGSTTAIQWISSSTIFNVKLEYWSQSAGNYVVIPGAGNIPNTGSYSWQIPDDITAVNNVKVKVSNAADSSSYDESDVSFKIRGDFAVLFPNAVIDTLRVGEATPVSWTTTGNIQYVKLEYSTDGGTTWIDPPIESNLFPNPNTYIWTVPDAITTTARFRVADVADPTVYDISNNNFRIMGKITVNQPSGSGIVWVVGTSQKIRWTTTATIPRVKIEWSETDFSTVYSSTEVDCGPAGVYEYDWTIPGRRL
ncbi:MAG: hypothetical protein HY762_02965 [Planctomycetes bacterium]|nr:hypothetical protein [Planctomycetota bacterium]